MSLTIKQHTVPYSFLKKFSDNGQDIHYKYKKVNIGKQPRNFELNKPTSLKSATTYENFYTLNGEINPMAIETCIYANSIESKYPKVYKLLTDANQLKITAEERMDILMSILSLHCRTPKQFRIFYNLIEKTFGGKKLTEIKEQYKKNHILQTFIAFAEQHEFKGIVILKIVDNCEFLSCDNPLLIIDTNTKLKNNNFQEQFNKENNIIVPIDPKHCICLLKGRNHNNYYRISRKDINLSTVQQINYLTIESADKLIFGSKDYLSAYFNLWRFETFTVK